MFEELNFVAIAAATLVNMVVGALWYSPLLFATAWLKEIGKSKDELKGQGRAMGLALLTNVFVAFVMAVIFARIGVGTVYGGLSIAFLLWIGFSLTTQIIHAIFHGNSLKLLAINAGNGLLSYLGMGAVLGVFFNTGIGAICESELEQGPG
jgi:hypothetical protein